VTIRRALTTVCRNQSGSLARILAEINALIAHGCSFTEAIRGYETYFPPLFLRLIETGERTGTLERVFAHLADYYERRNAMLRRTVASMIWPSFELLIAILVVGIVKLFATNFLYGETGISGRQAVIRHFITWGAIIGGIVAAYFVFTRLLRGRRFMHEILLRVPVIGYVTRTNAIARFTWALNLSNMAGLSIYDSLDQALAATNNAAFIAKRDLMLETLKAGGTLRQCMQVSGLFPQHILAMTEVAETSGKIDETMARIADQAFEDANMAMRMLSTAFGWFVWALVAGVIIYYIFVFFNAYLSKIQSLTS